ncbi:MAG: sigma-54-dependent Fis family transcriptional regulator [Lentisphaerae bacterium]|nr:sigma-54-dependent Fis family transcriptional regulator [Lentisphaerota bacterium]
MARILLVDDDAGITDVLSMVLETNKYEVTKESNGETASKLLLSEKFDLMISDIKMEPVDGMALLKLAHNNCPSMPVLMLTGNATLDSATEALKLGAFDYILKPFKINELLVTVAKALEHGEVTKADETNMPIVTEFYFDKVIAISQSMRNVCDMLKKVAPVDTPVLIHGESGVGKTCIAHAIHNASPRKNAKFMAISCSQHPASVLETELFGSRQRQGILESAEGGTVFLEELETIPPHIQECLAKTLQSKTITRIGDTKQNRLNTRIITSTTAPPDKIKDGQTIRPDLFNALSLINIEIKPLRERPEDILPIAQFILQQLAEKEGITASLDQETQLVLKSYSWPGNVREIANALRRAIRFAEDGYITKDLLPAKIADTPLQKSKGVRSDTDEYKGKSLKEFIRSQATQGLKIGLSQLKKQSETDNS